MSHTTDTHQVNLPELPATGANMSPMEDALRGPVAPARLDDFDVTSEILAGLTLKLAYTIPRFTSEWAARRLCLPLTVTAELLEQLRTDKLIEVLGQSGPFNCTFAITGRGRESATRLMEISGYVGPAPVSLQSYTAFLEAQFDHLPLATHEQVSEALSDVVLSPESVEVAGLAMTSRRSLFLNGPPGNGKTTVGNLLHNAEQGCLWIPHCIGVEGSIIRVYDPQCHQLVEETDVPLNVDRRWVRIERPLIVVGGELTLSALDLIYSASLGYYEAPLHFKANGGTFLLDDFGCQRMAPQQMLNRWIIPLERQVDYLTLQTGQQLEVPFRQMLIVSTNLDPEAVMSPAFLRRMGYRLYLDNPAPDRYGEIFHRYAKQSQTEVPSQLIEWLLARYQSEGRIPRGCEPRDLIERARDICGYRRQSFQLTTEIMETAWIGYFGNHGRTPQSD